MNCTCLHEQHNPTCPVHNTTPERGQEKLFDHEVIKIGIAPGLYRASLARQGIHVGFESDDDGFAITPMPGKMMPISDMINRIVTLDVVLNLVMDSNVRALAVSCKKLRQAFVDGDIEVANGVAEDTVDDLIAEIEAVAHNLEKIIEEDAHA